MRTRAFPTRRAVYVVAGALTIGGPVCALAGCNAILGNEPPTLRDGSADGDDAAVGDKDVAATDAPRTDAAACERAMTPCGGSCVDTSSDSKNCGACDYACEATCTAGMCEPKQLATGLGMSIALAVDATNVYVVDRGTGAINTGRIVRVPLPNGPGADIATGLANPTSIAADPSPGMTDVYYAVLGATPKVVRFNGTTNLDLPARVANAGVSGSHVRALAVEGNYLWGADDEKATANVWRATRAAAPSIDTQSALGAASGTLPASLEVRNGVAFVLSRTEGACNPASSIAKWTPGTAAALLVTTGCPHAVTALGSDVFYTDRTIAPGPGALRKVGATANVADGLAQPGAVVNDGTTLYWANQGSPSSDGSIERVDVAGPAMRPRATLAKKRAQPVAIALDKQFVYWLEANGTTGALYRLRR